MKLLKCDNIIFKQCKKIFIIKKIKNNKKDVSNYIKTNVPMNKLGCPDDISDAALFLCSDRTKFITGATLVVDGGQTKGVF